MENKVERGITPAVQEDGVSRRATITNALIAAECTRAEGEGRDFLVKARKVEEARRAVATEREATGREGIISPEAGRAIRDHRSTRVGIGIRKGEDASARVADTDARVARGLRERTTKSDRPRTGEVQERGTDDAVAHRLVGGDTGRGQRGQRFTEAIELEGRTITGAP